MKARRFKARGSKGKEEREKWELIEELQMDKTKKPNADASA